MTHNVAFIGLGVMGYHMAGHLATSGDAVTVYNRTSSVAQKWSKQFSGAIAPTAKEAATDAELVFVCVGNDDDVREVTLGDNGALTGMASGSVLVDHTTASAVVAQELAKEAAARGIAFMDAPVSGGEAGAINGQLSVMLGGDEAVYERVKPVIDAYAKATQLIGPVGHGQKAKMVNQICIAGLVQALAEGLHFAKVSGLDIDKVITAISKGAAQSWQMENRFETMVAGEFEFGFAVDWMRKDLNIALQAAEQLNTHLPVTALVDSYYAEIQEAGGSRWDTSSLITRLKA